MAGLFLRLKLRLLAGTLRSNVTAAVFAVAALASVGTALLVAFGLAALRGRPVAVDLAVGVDTLLVAAWSVGPPLLFASDETLDPARLATLPLRRRDLLGGLLAASAVGVGPLATAIVVTGGLLGTAHGPAGLLAAVVAGPALVVLCLVAGRAVTTTCARALRSRRGRDAAILLTLAIGVLPVTLNAVLLGAAADGGDRGRLVAVLRATPAGWLAAAPSEASAGRLGAAAAMLGGGVLAAAGLLAWWAVALARLLVRPDASTAGRRRRPARGATRRPARWPAGRGRVSATAGKELRCIWRDPRRRAGWGGVLVLGLVVIAPARGAGRPAGLVVAGCVVAVLGGLQTQNQLAVDGSGLWLSLATEERPGDLAADLAGRQLAAALVLGPLTVGYVLALAGLGAGWRLVGPALALSGALAGLVLGLAAVASVLAPVRLPLDTGNPFAAPAPGQGCLAGLAAVLVILLALVAALPVALLAGLAADHGWGGAVGLTLAGAGYGVVGAALGRRWAADLLRARAPEVLRLLS